MSRCDESPEVRHDDALPELAHDIVDP